jgi:hypothetical protein
LQRVPRKCNMGGLVNCRNAKSDVSSRLLAADLAVACQGFGSFSLKLLTRNYRAPCTSIPAVFLRHSQPIVSVVDFLCSECCFISVQHVNALLLLPKTASEDVLPPRSDCLRDGQKSRLGQQLRETLWICK